MKIVKFKDGKYGVRRWSLFYGFEFYSNNEWWRYIAPGRLSHYRTFEEAKEALDDICDFGKTVCAVCGKDPKECCVGT